MTIRTIIVDDEPHARMELARLLSEYENIDIVDECANAVEAVRSINTHRPDLMFLDIQMPGINGFELIGMIDEERMPSVVFVTAYDEYAVKAFEERAVDYLLKPVEQPRLAATVDRVRASLINADEDMNDAASFGQEITRIPSALRNVIKLVPVDDVEYARIDQTGVHIVTAEHEYFTDVTLKTLESRTRLTQCHRQYLVNLDRVDQIILHENGAGEIRTHGGATVPVSRRHLKRLKDSLSII